ncbi:MAG: YdgA family protein [Gammaproteobacteria bacterium]|nr:YdgA family protein [Gammaproteobacteria bacterium]
MKKIVILISILVVALFVAPGVIGFMAQNQYQEIIIGMQQAGLEVTRNDYQRGWFGSRSETEFKLALPQDLGVEGFTLSMHSDLVHGPLSPDGGIALASVGTYFKINGEALFPEDENRILNTVITLGGNGKTLIEIPALKLAGEPGTPEIQFSGADGVLLFDTSFSRLDIDLNIPAFWLGGGEGQGLKITEVTLGSKTNKDRSNLRLGSGKLGIKQIGFVKPKDGVDIKIDAIDLYGDTQVEGDNLTFTANYSLQAVAINETNYGPAELEFDISNISAAITARLQQEMQDIRRQKLSQEQRGMALMSMLMEAAPDLLKANPRLKLKRLFVKTPDGDIEGNLTLATDGLLWSDLGSAQAVLGKLNADASLRMPEKLLRSMLEKQAQQSVRQQVEMRKQIGEEIAMPSEDELQLLGRDLVEQRLSGLLQQQMLVRDGEHISSNAKLGGGLLSVNGKTIPLFMAR